MTLHGAAAFPDDIGQRVVAWMNQRITEAPLGRAATSAELRPLFGDNITAEGLGAATAWDRFADRVVPNTVGIDSERFLAFIPIAPSAAAVWMDAAVGAASFSAESWLEAAGAVAAENEVLRWLADLVGMPASAGGCFMSGGSIGNLSALAVARDAAPVGRRVVAVADTVHASVHNALHLLGMHDVVVVPTDGVCTGAALAAAVGSRTDIGIVVASAGSTNAGLVDELSGLADWCERNGAWLHVDAAYGGAALLLPERRAMFAGLERADSIIIDPHKWLFAPAGSCAVLYREPDLAAKVHTQHGPYLDVLHDGDEVWNPSDYGFQLTRRASGLPLWFSLVVHGVDAYVRAVRASVDLAAYAAERLERIHGVSLVHQPQLGVVLFRRSGWRAGEWSQWARRLLADGVAFVAPSTWRGEPVGRLVFLHPHTTTAIVDEVVATLI